MESASFKNLISCILRAIRPDASPGRLKQHAAPCRDPCRLRKGQTGVCRRPCHRTRHGSRLGADPSPSSSPMYAGWPGQIRQKKYNHSENPTRLRKGTQAITAILASLVAFGSENTVTNSLDSLDTCESRYAPYQPTFEQDLQSRTAHRQARAQFHVSAEHRADGLRSPFVE